MKSVEVKRTNHLADHASDTQELVLRLIGLDLLQDLVLLGAVAQEESVSALTVFSLHHAWKMRIPASA